MRSRSRTSTTRPASTSRRWERSSATRARVLGCDYRLIRLGDARILLFDHAPYEHLLDEPLPPWRAAHRLRGRRPRCAGRAAARFRLPHPDGADGDRERLRGAPDLLLHRPRRGAHGGHADHPGQWPQLTRWPLDPAILVERQPARGGFLPERVARAAEEGGLPPGPRGPWPLRRWAVGRFGVVARVSPPRPLTRVAGGSGGGLVDEPAPASAGSRCRSGARSPPAPTSSTSTETPRRARRCPAISRARAGGRFDAGPHFRHPR